MTDFHITNANRTATGTGSADKFYVDESISDDISISGQGGIDALIANVSVVDLNDALDFLSSIEKIIFGSAAAQNIFLSQATGGGSAPVFEITGFGSNLNKIFWTAGSGSSFDFSGITGTFSDANKLFNADFSALGSGVHVTGANVNFAFTGTSHADTFIAAGNKTNSVYGAGSSDNMTGGGGLLDNAIYSGKKSDYEITKTGSSVTVKDLRAGSPDGTDTLTNFEELRFADGVTKVADLGNRPPALSPGQNLNLVWSAGEQEFKAFVVIDPDGDAISYTVKSADPQRDISWLTVKVGPNIILEGEVPYDTKINQYKIVATAHDGHGHNVDIPITINVNHVPILENLQWLTVVEAKKAGVDLNKEFIDIDISDPGMSDDQVKSMSAAIQPGFAHQKLTFTLAGGKDKGDFKLTDTGIVKFKGGADFEHPRDANHDNRYKVKVTASDGFASVKESLTIKVKDDHSAKMTDMAAELDIAHHPGDWLFYG